MGGGESHTPEEKEKIELTEFRRLEGILGTHDRRHLRMAAN